MRHHIFLSLGSNLGNKHALLKQAIMALQQRVGSLVACSSFIETEPWGFKSDNTFLNAAVWMRTTLSPEQLLIATQEIEREMGRTTKSTDRVYHDRTIDIDILLYDDLQLDKTFTHQGAVLRLTIPHPHMHEREFVMIPLREIHSS